MLKSSFCDYSDASILAVRAGATEAARHTVRNNKQEIFKNCTPFTYCVTGINNTQIDNV